MVRQKKKIHLSELLDTRGEESDEIICEYPPNAHSRKTSLG
jgi:hypothetical protein